MRDIGSPQPESVGSPPNEFPEEDFLGSPAEAPPPAEGPASPVEIPDPGGVGEPTGPEPVLVVNPQAPTTRLVRETLENFTNARVETTSDFLRAFELALQKRYRLFLFGMRIGDYSGPILYELISKAYSTGYGSQRLAPAVVFIREKDDPRLPRELERDARVRDVLSKPIRIERLLKSVEGALDVRDPTSG